ncbi:vascular cell adhesion protein 1-like [Mustelus asterias]
MDFRLTSRFGDSCFFTLLFTVTADIIAGFEMQINANPPAVAFGDSVTMNCSTTCPTDKIIIEGMKEDNKTCGEQWCALYSSNIQSWSVRMTCVVKCQSEPSQREKAVTVYNREINITSPPEVLEADRTYSLECIGPRVYPNNKLILTWLRGSEIVQSNSTGEQGYPDEDKRLRNVFSFTANVSDDGQVYTCLAEVDLGSNDRKLIANSSVTLQTHYKPMGTTVLANNKTISESPVHLSNGDSIILICDSQGNPRPNLTWEYPKQSNVVMNSSGVLHISDATTKNNGIYKCTATNKLGADRKTVNVSVEDIIAGFEMQINANPPAVAFGDSVTMNCSTTCPTDKIIIEGIRLDNKTCGEQWCALYSSNIQSWSVRMTCVVKCQSEPSQREKAVTVYNREVNITSPPEVLEVNRTYSLECIGPRVYPNNKLILTWLRGSEIVQSNSTGEQGYPDEDKRLRNVFSFTASVSDDGQVYTCLAEVDLGPNNRKMIANSSVTLQTHYKPGNTTISVNDKTVSGFPVNVSKGDEVTLICNSNGNPTPTLKWEDPSNGSNVEIAPPGILHIPHATSGHQGIYKCTATNPYGIDEKEVDIRVTDKPGDTTISVNNKTVSGFPVNVSKGDEVTLICNSNGNPTPTLKWEDPSNGSNVKIAPPGILRIFHATSEHQGIYKCTATNPYGIDEKEVDIRVTDEIKASWPIYATIIIIISIVIILIAMLSWCLYTAKRKGIYDVTRNSLVCNGNQNTIPLNNMSQ